LERASEAARAGELTETHVRKWLDEMLESTGFAPVRIGSVRSFSSEWLSGKRLSVTLGAALRYERAVKLFLEGLDLRADKPLSGVTASDITAYRNARLKENVIWRNVEALRRTKRARKEARRKGKRTAEAADTMTPASRADR
jgi:hypothetical protein